MDYAHSHGFPVPAVDETSEDGTEVVMERIEGPSMVKVMSRCPWTMRRHADVLAELHQRLHDIPGPSWLPPVPGATGDRLVHLDLHPLNVIYGPSGPVLIDWSNAATSDPDVDVALTWLLMASGGTPRNPVLAALLGLGRRPFLSAFLRHFDRGPVRAKLAAASGLRDHDENLRPAEKAAMRRLVEESAG